MLSQLMRLFGFFSLVLVLVYWVNRAVSLFDRLIANGHSAAVFLEFTALTLPNVIRLVLPVSAFAAAVYVTNRLSSESELVAVQATGYSPMRLARAVAVFGVIVAVLISVLMHVLVPVSSAQLRQRTAEISENATARLLTEGEFLHPSDGVTFYIREITPEGELRDIYLSDRRGDRRASTYTAERALLLRGDEGPRLVMFDGMIQSLRDETRQLATTTFRDFTFDLGSVLEMADPGPRRLREVGTLELLTAPDAIARETDEDRAEVLYEAHARFTQAVKGLVAPLLGFSILLVGGFSRFGLWRQILGAIFAISVFEFLDNAAADAAQRGPGMWPLLYLPGVVGVGAAVVILWQAGRPRGRPRGAGAVA
ncbi:LPS export ABC transporter permease LptF [Tranquillimonas alkanivorans]|uniref:Lipopolysaccharide export system permease protein n=1 Tax=Tranquillimonas alkanivorans TaxID=441119 RepID=A0A1I5QLN2_9RHOB|nr:LPS export ABC transporter permease LptF [Tranquillimonas alkanivorans]SFP47169.1 lipopolysaccharide export system permease protein [Tranquillimonas alkanivorans]